MLTLPHASASWQSPHHFDVPLQALTKAHCVTSTDGCIQGAVPRLVSILGRMRARDVGPDYTYYGIASPWLQVPCLGLTSALMAGTERLPCASCWVSYPLH